MTEPSAVPAVPVPDPDDVEDAELVDEHGVDTDHPVIDGEVLGAVESEELDVDEAEVVDAEVVEEPPPARPSLAPGPSARTRMAPPTAVEVPDVPAAAGESELRGVPELDELAMTAARADVARRPELGRLGPVLTWLAGAQGTTPHAFSSPVVLVAAARHDDAAYVDAGASFDDRVASLTFDLPWRLLDLGAGDVHVRDSAGDIRTEDALAADEALRAFALGRLAVDREVDAGADVLLVGDVAAESGPATAALAAVITATQPQSLVGRRGLSTHAWIRAVEVTRDARARAKGLAAQALPLLAAIGGADHAALAGMLVQAAYRKTPVLISGPAAHVAGLVAETYAEGSSLWWTSASSSGDPAEAAAIKALELEPLLDLDLGLDACTGGVLALGVLQELLRA